jgi:hypothetical protein
MRTYGRINGQWVAVETAANGANDYVYLTTLIQCLKLSPGESPFYANYGVPAAGSVVQQILPTFYMNRLQKQFAQYFASLSIAYDTTATTPTYNISVMFNNGTTYQAKVAI